MRGAIPWDDFDNCVDGNSAYLCSSPEGASEGARGLECRGCDRNDAADSGGLYIYVNDTDCGGVTCQAVNVTFYQVIQSADDANEGSAVFVADEDGTYRIVSQCMDGDSQCDCDVQAGCGRATMGAYAEFVNVDVCQITGINCSEDLTLWFTSYNDLNHGTGDYFAWDEVIVTGYAPKGTIPMNSGDPFYTTAQNPRYAANESCLQDMLAGEGCTLTWPVNATGEVNTSHTFFAYTTSETYTQVNSTTTEDILVTIVGNVPPIVAQVTLAPSPAQYLENLTCTYTVTDANSFDTLQANITWYRNATAYSTVTRNISNGVQAQEILDSSSTAAGETWICQVQGYDQSAYGTAVNSSAVSIITNFPPNITDVMCDEDSLGWVECTSILYETQLSRVRANCSSTIGIQEVNFTLTNIDAGIEYFSNSTTVIDSGYYVYDSPDLVINRSGTYVLTTSCLDTDNVLVSTNTTWLVPFGTLISTLINPAADTFVQKDQFFNFTVNISCHEGECGTGQAFLDPEHAASYNYVGGLSGAREAFEVDSDANPAEATPNSRTTLTAGDATAISASDDSVWQSIDPDNGDYVSLELIMTLDNPSADVTGLDFLAETRTFNNAFVTIYVYNNDDDAWEEVASQFQLAGVDTTLTGSLQTGSAYVNSSRQCAGSSCTRTRATTSA
ncbi:MAG: hypothetical protein HC945_03295 [Nitrosarchaeum sp.]|nr:hypothetical protein [Nitrosarchaeum sp.]